ncbi:hypothetical protein ERO13_D02G039033v2 [Gossypium hirsutum]|uniref:Pentacotripeptide-repeat region of PRORP domain-containing protein n=1 Tax=Gossypium tomentosum TaxID=34277 RepID=A0A5D2LTH9_GOSTO|nr:hypothetical protein ERO13_D02G039033v2 [Gossypium hirsutum]TYH82344.1 hypothetical protein ES332_D02G053200v1 [Gossypium tomentosum]
MNEKGYGVDTVTCNIVINGLCKSGKLDKAMEIAHEMWTHGSAALVTYFIIISALCKAGKIDEAKKKFREMMGKNLQPDAVIFDTFIHIFCKEVKISSAFPVLKDMEKKGCNKSVQTYNSLILGLGTKNQIFEIYGLFDEMRERGITPNMLIEAFYKASDFGVAKELFEIGLSICGHKEFTYSF